MMVWGIRLKQWLSASKTPAPFKRAPRNYASNVSWAATVSLTIESHKRQVKGLIAPVTCGWLATNVMLPLDCSGKIRLFVRLNGMPCWKTLKFWYTIWTDSAFTPHCLKSGSLPGIVTAINHGSAVLRGEMTLWTLVDGAIHLPGLYSQYSWTVLNPITTQN